MNADKLTTRDVVTKTLTDEQVFNIWYDWFCRDASLVNKGRKLISRLRGLALSKKIDLDNTYVLFKNNCPMNGTLYDDFRICDIKSGDVIYTVTPAVGYTKTKGQSEAWGRENDFKEPLVAGTWEDVKKFFFN